MSAPEDAPRRRPWRLAAKVIAVQVVTLLALWLMQAAYGS